MVVDERVEFDGLVGVQSWDMLGVGDDLLLGGCGVGDLLLDYPLPGDVFVKGYGLLEDKSNEDSLAAPREHSSVNRLRTASVMSSLAAP